MDYTFEELVDAALAAKNALEPDMESYNILMEMASEIAPEEAQVKERQGWVKDWLGTPQSLFEEPQTAGGIALDTAKAAGAGLLRGAQGIAETPELLIKGAGRIGQEAKYGLGNVPAEEAINPFNTFTGAGADFLFDKAGLTKARDYRSEGGLASLAGVGGEFGAAGISKAPKTMAKALPKMFGFGVASEAAGQALDESGYGDVARIGVGLAAPSTLSAVRRPINPIDGQNLSDARFLQGKGVKLGLSDITGGRPAPGASVGLEKGKDYTRSILESIGIRTGTTISSFVDDVPKLITSRQQQLNSEMKNATQGLNIKFDGSEQRQISAIGDRFKANKGVSPTVDEPNTTIKRLKKRFLKVNEPISRDNYMSMRSDLSLLTTNNNPAVSRAANEMLQVLDDAVDRTLVQSGNVDSVGILAKNRSNLRDIYAVVDSLEGNSTKIIDPSALNRSLNRQNSNQMFKGERGELGELASAGDRLIPGVRPPKGDQSFYEGAKQFAAETSPYTMLGGGATQMLVQSGQGNLIGPVLIALGIGSAAFNKLAKTQKGQEALIKRALRSDMGTLGEDKIRTIIATAASQTIDEDQQ